MRVTEDKAKAWLAARGIPTPCGRAADSPAAAAAVARDWNSGAVVKALIPTGRRGKAGAVRICRSESEVEAAAADILGTVVNGYAVKQVYVEQKIDIAKELYLSFYLENFPPQMLLSAEGGVEIETVHSERPAAVLANAINPLKGVPSWDAIAQWEKTQVESRFLPALGQITTQLYDAFVASNASMLEINPLVIDSKGQCLAVGAMMATDDLLFASGNEDAVAAEGRPLTALERRVIEANAAIPGGMIRYTELDGDIGMFIGGGGASLVQHDLVLKAGGRPANHMDASTTNPDKVRALVETILDKPGVRGLLVGWHYQQMAQIDRRVGPIIQVLKERDVDPDRFPIVIRMFGPGEDQARRMAAELPGVHYMQHGAPMEEAVRLIVELTRRSETLSLAS